MLATSPSAQAQIFDFNTAGQLEHDFYSTGGTAWSQAAAGGLNNSGWAITGSGNAAHAAEVLDQTFAGDVDSFTLSIYFQWKTLTQTTPGTSLYLGFGTNTNEGSLFTPQTGGGSAGTETLQFGINSVAASPTNQTVRLYGYSVVNGVGTVFTGATTEEGLVDQQWYHLSGVVTRNANGNGYQLNLALSKSNAMGSIGETMASYSSPVDGFINPALVAGDVHAYFITGSNVQTRGIAGVDDFRVTAIPEPSVAAGWLLGTLLVGTHLLRSGRLKRS